MPGPKPALFRSLHRRLHRMMGCTGRSYRWLVYSAVVTTLVTWTYLAHPARLLHHDPQAAPARSRYSVQIIAPRSVDNEVADQNDINNEEDDEFHKGNEPVKSQDPKQSGLNDMLQKMVNEHYEDAIVVPAQSEMNDEDELSDDIRYKQVLLEQVEKKLEPRLMGNELTDGSRYRQVLLEQAEEEVEVEVDRPLTETEMHETQRELRLRAIRVKDTCAKYNLGLHRHPARAATVRMRYPPSANYDVLYIDRPDSLTWCPVYKAASTSWLHNLCLLAGMKESFLSNTKEQISTVARGVWPQLDYDEAVQAVPHTTKFMIVRHPFERLVSAYRDKLENLNIGQEHGVQHFYEAYGKRIVSKYRTETTDTNRTRVRLSTSPDQPAPRGIEPTFLEFVRYLLDTDLVHHSDDHWMPYYLYCTPCYINYDVIAKFETLDRDQRYLLQKLNLYQKISPKWKHLTKGQKTADIVKQYLHTLSKDEIEKLYKKYKLDFEMYDYTISDYL